MTALSMRAAAFAAVMISACYAPSEGQVHSSICASIDDADDCAVADKIIVQIDLVEMQRIDEAWWVKPTGAGPFKDAYASGLKVRDSDLGSASIPNATTAERDFSSRAFGNGSLILFEGTGKITKITVKLSGDRVFDQDKTSGGQAFPKVEFADGGKTAIFSGGSVAPYGATNRKPMWMKMPGGTFYRGSTEGQACDSGCSDPDPETDQDLIDTLNALGEDLDGLGDYPVFP